MSHDHQLCPECGEEYTLAARVCGDCGVALVYPDAVLQEAAEDFPPVSQLACVRVGPLPWTRALSEALTRQGIAHRIEADTRGEAEGGVAPGSFGGLDVFGTWVRPAELEAARDLDAALFAHLEPDRQAPAEGDEPCPACQARLPADALECPECGLAFG